MSQPTPEEIRYFEAHKSDDRQGELYAAAVSTLILAWLFVALRFISRWNISAGLRTDDWLIVAAATAFTAFPIGIFILLGVGFGRHIIFVTDPQKMVEMVVLCEIAYSVTIPLTKLSILSLYNRVFPSAMLRKASVLLAVITVLYSMALGVVCILQCIPLSTLWGASDGWCMNTTPPYTVTAVANVVTDIAVLCLPMPLLYQLNMRLGRKLQLMALFALGGCVCVFGIVRSIEVGTASYKDQSWSTVNGTIWSAVEPCVGIISACLPTLRGLLRRDREAHTGYTDYERDGEANISPGSLARRFGWVPKAYPGGRRKSLHSSLVLKSGASANNKPQVWSTVTSGLPQSSVERSRHDNDGDEHNIPFARLDSEGKTQTRSATPQQLDQMLISDGASSTMGRRRSLNDIHIKTEVTQEVSRAGLHGDGM